MAMVEVPAARIDPDTLERLVEEFVTRDGTDYGEKELTLAQKKAAVARQIDRGDVVLVFDTETETANLVTREELIIMEKSKR
jgi:uncharacterized protein